MGGIALLSFTNVAIREFQDAAARLGLTGRGDAGGPHRRPFIFRETSEDFSESVGAFRRLLGLAQIPDKESAIICRGNDHLQSVRGQVNYANLEGKTKRLAESASCAPLRAVP